MALKEKLQEEVAKYLAIALLALALFVLAAIWVLPGELLPTQVIQWLDEYSTGETLLRALLVTAGLAAWIIYLRPWLRFDKRLGIYRDIRTGLYYCTRCKTEKRIHTPLLEIPNRGWHCVSCKWIYDDPDRDQPPKRKVISRGSWRI